MAFASFPLPWETAPVPTARAEDRARRPALAILAMAMVIGAGALIYWGRGQVMSGDDLFYAQRLSENPLGHAILHSNLYLIALPMVLYKAMFEVFGIGSYVPYRLAAIILSLLCTALFYAIARRRIGSLLALAPTILLLFFGSGWEELITGMRIPSLFAIASGLGAILALEREDARGDALAAALLCVSVTSHPTGLGFLAAAVVIVAFRPSPRRWRSSWVVVIPAALFGAFLAFYQHTVDTVPQPHASDVLAFVRASWTMLTAAVSGLSGILDAPVYDRSLAEIAAGALLGLILVGAALRWRRLRPTFWAAVAGLVTLMVATRMSPAGSIRTPDQPRYLYPEAFLFLWILVELAGAWRDKGTVRTRMVVAGFATGALLLGLWSNVAKLHDASSRVRATSTVAQGDYSAYDLERGRLTSSYAPNPFLPTAGNYLSAAAAYGSMGLSPSELARAPEAGRASADRALVGALGLQLKPAAPPPARGPPPQVEKPLGSTSITHGGCVALRLARDIGLPAQPPASAPAAAQPPLAELDLPSGGAWIGSDHLGDATFTLGRFADPPVAPLTPPAGNRTGAALRIPPDGAGVPWKLQIASRKPVRVCGLP
jgi:hypothetical protein